MDCLEFNSEKVGCVIMVTWLKLNKGLIENRNVLLFVSLIYQFFLYH